MEKALARVDADATFDIRVTSAPATVAEAERIVLPGVGAFADCMAGLNRVEGLREALGAAVLKRHRPFLGICVGMQMLADVGREFRTADGLGWIGGAVTRIVPVDPALKIPHMGWNELRILGQHPVLDGIENGAHAYFVHSYAFRADDPVHVLADTDYGEPIAACIGRDNLFGTQFHPEKSQAVGLHILQNFLAWRP